MPTLLQAEAGQGDTGMRPLWQVEGHTEPCGGGLGARSPHLSLMGPGSGSPEACIASAYLFVCLVSFSLTVMSLCLFFFLG